MTTEMERCHEPLPLTHAAIQAFESRQAKLLKHPKWPMQGWYNDASFCRAVNTAIALKADNDQLREQLSRVSDGSVHVMGVDLPVAKPIANMAFAHALTCALGLDKPGVISVSEKLMLEAVEKLKIDLLDARRKAGGQP